MKNQQTILTPKNLCENNFASVISLPIARLKVFENKKLKIKIVTETQNSTFPPVSLVGNLSQPMRIERKYPLNW